MPKEDLTTDRSETMSGRHREVSETRRCQSQLSVGEHSRSGSRTTNMPPVSAHCANCKHPLMIDVTTNEMIPESRASARRESARSCNHCSRNKSRATTRTPSSRLYKSASFDWTDVGDKIETWFEKAKTPDQRVVYNFLEQLHDDENKPVEPAPGKSLDEILNNLKKYRSRFNANRNPNKYSHGFESTSWRVMRHSSNGPRQFSRVNPVFGDDASRDFRIGTTFYTTEPRIGSTFLLHPGWV